ncbi:MAG: hypothetical protein HYR85_10950 [Planctomycetes bacterium]|nr:hypothetical protein [Planctomycetota bacterium]MBI3843406.1 hypothetical protein [Planctomycetota bacterium]
MNRLDDRQRDAMARRPGMMCARIGLLLTIGALSPGCCLTGRIIQSAHQTPIRIERATIDSNHVLRFAILYTDDVTYLVTAKVEPHVEWHRVLGRREGPFSG